MFLYLSQDDTPDRLVNAVDYLLPFVGKTFVSHGCLWWDTFRCLPALGGGQNGKVAAFCDGSMWLCSRHLVQGVAVV